MADDDVSTPRPDDAGRGRPEVVLVTGAAGRIGTYLRPRLARPGRVLRLLDVDPVGEEPADGEEVLVGSVCDPETMARATAGATAVVHLAGLASEADWEDLLELNIRGTHVVFEAARAAGVPRLVYASSNHAVGYREDVGGELDDGLRPRPESFYGVSKAHGEALGSLYADRHGLDVVCLRIGTCADEPGDARALATWLSPDDAGRLVEAALAPQVRGYHTVWGVSRNRRRWWSLAAGRAIGFEPRDDAEDYAAGLPDEDAGTTRRTVSGLDPSTTPHWG